MFQSVQIASRRATFMPSEQQRTERTLEYEVPARRQSTRQTHVNQSDYAGGLIRTGTEVEACMQAEAWCHGRERGEEEHEESRAHGAVRGAGGRPRPRVEAAARAARPASEATLAVRSSVQGANGAEAAARTARPAAGRRPSPRCSPVFPRAGLAASSGPPRPGAASANPPWLLPGARARSRRAKGAKPACLALRRSPPPLGPGRDRGAQLLRGLLAHIGRAGARSPRSLPRVKADGRQTASGQGGRRRARGRG